MYSYDERIRAVKLYLKLGKRTGPTIRQLGYPTKNALKSWYREYKQGLFLLHETLNDFFRDEHLLPAERSAHPPIAVATMIALKDLSNGKTCISVFVRLSQAGAVVKVRAARAGDCSDCQCRFLRWCNINRFCPSSTCR